MQTRRTRSSLSANSQQKADRGSKKPRPSALGNERPLARRVTIKPKPVKTGIGFASRATVLRQSRTLCHGGTTSGQASEPTCYTASSEARSSKTLICSGRCHRHALRTFQLQRLGSTFIRGQAKGRCQASTSKSSFRTLIKMTPGHPANEESVGYPGSARSLTSATYQARHAAPSH